MIRRTDHTARFLRLEPCGVSSSPIGLCLSFTTSPSTSNILLRVGTTVIFSSHHGLPHTFSQSASVSERKNLCPADFVILTLPATGSRNGGEL
jgi:hypothetical protein